MLLASRPSRRFLAAFLFFLGGLRLSAACPTSYPVPPSGAPETVAVGDFNRDGTDDLAIASLVNNSMTIWLGNGDGTFVTGASYGIGTQPTAVVTGDFNRDGRLDLVLTNASSHQVGIRLGNGDGTFAATMTSYATGGSTPVGVAVAEFNDDGLLDLVITNRDSNNVTLLEGNGDGTFDPAVAFAIAVSAQPSGIAVADLNHDGRPDVITANQGLGSVSVLLGNGPGTFAAPSHYAAGPSAFDLVVADFDRDGNDDVAVTNYVFSGTLSVLRGTGTGGFLPLTSYGAGAFPRSILALDHNRDGKIDLVSARGNVSDNSGTSIFPGNGNGTFAPRVNQAIPAAIRELAAGNFDGDASRDVVVAAWESVSVVFGNVCSGIASFGAPANHLASTGPSAVATGDLNLDGLPDIAVTNQTSDEVSVLLSSSTGLQPATHYATGDEPKGIVLADLNHDGTLDMAVSNAAAGTVSVLLNSSAPGSFDPESDFAAGSSPHSIAVADFNRDGDPDLVVTNTGSNTVSRLSGNGTGSFGAPSAVVADDGPTGVAVGDFNRDGREDLAVTSVVNDRVSILLATVSGFAAPVRYQVGSAPASIAAADLDRDGSLDLVVGNAADISILMNAGNGTFSSNGESVAGTNAARIVTADIDGDGDVDVAVPDSGNDLVTLFLNDGSGAMTASGTFATGSTPVALAAADFDGDGTPDLVSANESSDDVSILSNTGACPSLSLTGVSPASGAVAGGNSVTITGARLAGATSVTFGGVPASITMNTATSVTVTVPPHAAGFVDIVVTAANGTGGLECAYKYLSAPAAPSFLNTYALSATSIFVFWSAVDDATSYEVERKAPGGSFVSLGSTSSTALEDSSCGVNTSYLYRVRATSPGGTGPFSAPVLATTVIFTDAPLTGVPVKASHLVQLRTAVAGARALAGLTPFSFSAASAGSAIQAVHVTELRSALGGALSTLGLPAVTYTDPALGAIIIKGVHFEELRTAAGQ